MSDPRAELSASMQALAASVTGARADMAELKRLTARCLATAERCLAELRAMNAEADRAEGCTSAPEPA